MLLKLQGPVVGQQPNISAGGTAKMNIPAGPRVGVIYAQLTVTKAAGGSGVYSTPVLSDIADPNRNIVVSIGGKDQILRAPLELADDNALQSDRCYGSVSFYQAGVLVSTVYDVRNTAQAPGIAANTATTAVFQLPIYFFEPWRKDLTIAESYALPTTFSNGTNLPVLQVAVPIAPGATGFSDHGAFFWMSYDELPGTPVNGAPLPFFVKKGRVTELYATAGDKTIPVEVSGQLMQASVILAAGDVFEKVVIKKNGKTLRQVTKEQNDQTIYDHEMNIAAVKANRLDIVFDINDSPASALPLGPADIFEFIVTLKTVAAPANMVILTEVYGQPN